VPMYLFPNGMYVIKSQPPIITNYDGFVDIIREVGAESFTLFRVDMGPQGVDDPPEVPAVETKDEPPVSPVFEESDFTSPVLDNTEEQKPICNPVDEKVPDPTGTPLVRIPDTKILSARYSNVPNSYRNARYVCDHLMKTLPDESLSFLLKLSKVRKDGMHVYKTVIPPVPHSGKSPGLQTFQHLIRPPVDKGFLSCDTRNPSLTSSRLLAEQLVPKNARR